MGRPDEDPPRVLAGEPEAAGEDTGSTATLQPDEQRRKAHATWAARAALAGHQLHRLDDGRWLAIRNAWSRELDEAEVEGWLQLIGAPQ